MRKLQNFVARVAVGGESKYNHVSPVFDELKWLKIKTKHLFDTLDHVFVNQKYLCKLEFFSSIKQVTRGNTRKENKLHVPRHKTDAGPRSKKISGPREWNGLPSDI